MSSLSEVFAKQVPGPKSNDLNLTRVKTWCSDHSQVASMLMTSIMSTLSYSFDTMVNIPHYCVVIVSVAKGAPPLVALSALCLWGLTNAQFAPPTLEGMRKSHLKKI